MLNDGSRIFTKCFLWTFLLVNCLHATIALGQVSPDKIKFVRQGTQRIVFDESQAIPLAVLDPKTVVGFSAMHPTTHYRGEHSEVALDGQLLTIHSERETETAIWFGGFNPFATYSLDIQTAKGTGEVGFEFSDAEGKNRFLVKVAFGDSLLTDARLKVLDGDQVVADESIAINAGKVQNAKGKLILQMLGSGLTLFMQQGGELPQVIGQSDFNPYLDLRKKEYMENFHSRLFAQLQNGQVGIRKVNMTLGTGMGQADIRAITYENGEPLLDQGRLWYTMTIRGRALPHHTQGVFSMDPSVFDVKLEGLIVFDRNDGLLRNEVASHIFYDRQQEIWRGITTGFSAYANPEKEKKQLLAIESKRDPRFGFSVMKAAPFGMVGDIEDPHILYDAEAEKWRMLACENHDGYKAIVLESDHWNRDYEQIAGPVAHNSTGTSIQKIGNTRFCFSGSSERRIFVYTYPDLVEVGSLVMDLPPWDETSGTRVWPNVVQLPEGYPFRYVALMMDRFNYPGQQGPHWSYGALYLYHGYEP